MDLVLGTTHFLNAVIQRKGLVRVSVLRLCGEASHALPPFSDMDQGMKNCIKGVQNLKIIQSQTNITCCFPGEIFLADGGFNVDGKPLKEINKGEIIEIANKLREKKMKHVVLSG